ncbi:MAG TPA: TlpA disulfide reductase family protein [Terriglobia bacterium]|nr:TlpA disulfide reductase family protein [Terriglobia bacterium]
MGKQALRNLILGGMMGPLVAASLGLLQAQSVTYPCQPSKKVQSALGRLDAPVNVELTTAAERRSRERATLESILAENPGNLFVLRRLEGFSIYSFYEDPAALAERYKASLSEHPNSPVYLDLYGYVLAGYHTREAEQEFHRALAIAPNFPWPHLDLATRVYGKGIFRNVAKYEQNLQAFMSACPSTLEPFSDLGAATDSSFLRASAVRLRKLLSQRTDEKSVGYYSSLWALEYRVTPPAQTAAVKKQVATDIGKMRALKLYRSTSWYSVLADGYKLLNDQAGQQWVREQELKNLPDASDTIVATYQEWSSKHPVPGEHAAPKKKQAYDDELLTASSDWIRRWPNFTLGWSARFDALMDMHDAPIAELESTADGLLRTAARNPDQFSTGLPFSIDVAEAYVKRGIRLESVPRLVEDGFKDFAAREKRLEEVDFLSPATAEIMKSQPGFVHWTCWKTLVDAYLKMKQASKATEVLAQMETFVGQQTPGTSATTDDKNAYLSFNKDYWNRMAQLAELENHKLDALAYYHAALQDLSELPGAYKRDDKTATRARKLWDAMGGTAEGWQAWLAQVFTFSSGPTTAASTWNAIDQPLPDFDLVGVGGKTWSLAEIKGKVTFIDVWATWCGPCRSELPFVQKLYNQLKGKPGISVLTLNDDENPGLAEQFMKAHHYDFPAALAYNYLDSILADTILPRNWIVDRNGVRRLQTFGFGGESDAWMKDVLTGIAGLEKQNHPGR